MYNLMSKVVFKSFYTCIFSQIEFASPEPPHSPHQMWKLSTLRRISSNVIDSICHFIPCFQFQGAGGRVVIDVLYKNLSFLALAYWS